MTSQHPALGIDYGEARIGIAATDPVGIMAHPVETIHRHKTESGCSGSVVCRLL